MKNMKKVFSYLLILIFALCSLFSQAEGKRAVFALDSSQPEGIKNIVIMIGDGMGPVHEESGRIFAGRDLAWDNMPYSGTSNTNSLSGTTDSAAAGTAMSSGVRVHNGLIGRSGANKDLKTILEYAGELGKKTGVVTSCELYDATPAAFSAKANDRSQYETIKASQVQSGIDLLIGERGDGYDAYASQIAALGYEYITDKGDLDQSALSYDKIFAPLPAIKPEQEMISGAEELYKLAQFSLEFLENDDGFVLMIEGAKIDKRSHQRSMAQMVYELMAFDKAVDAVLDWAEGRDDTIVIVTADHETGGLELLGGVNQSNILSGQYNVWNAWDGISSHQASHTSTPVSYYVYGGQSAYMNDSIIISDIFKIMYSFLRDVYEVLDFESDYHINNVSTTNDNNAVEIDRVDYSRISINMTTSSDLGSFGVELTPTVNPWPEVHFTFAETYPAGTKIRFDYYVKTSQSCAYAWNSKNPSTGAGMGELDSFTCSQRNKWFEAIHTFEYDFKEVWLWLYLECSDATQVDIIIDNFRVIPAFDVDDKFDFETGDQINYFKSVNPLGHDMHADFDIVSYDEADLDAPSGCGDYLLKVSPTHAACGYLLFEIHNGYVIPAGSTIKFNLYIEAPGSYNNFYIRYWDHSPDDVVNISNNTWHDISIDTSIDSGNGGNLAKYIYIFLRNRSVTPATNVKMYIDNLEIIEPDFVNDFEDESQLAFYESINPYGHTMHVDFDIVSYTGEGLTAPAGCGDYLLKVTPTHADCGYMLFKVNNNFAIPQGSTIRFKLYIAIPGYKNDFRITYADKDNVDFLESNTWHDIEIDTSIRGKGYYLYIYLRNRSVSPATNIEMYIDNLEIVIND